MKIINTEPIILFTICVGIGFYIVVSLGLGGAELQNMNFWGSVAIKLLVSLTIAVGAIVIAMGLSGTQASFIGSGVTIGNRVADAAAITTLETIYLVCAWQFTDFIYLIPQIGNLLGTFCIVVALIILVLDVIDRTTTSRGA